MKKKQTRVTGYGLEVKPDSRIIENPEKIKTRLVIGIPTTGIIRYEWALARWGQVIPVNWSMAEVAQAFSQVGPIGYLVADARNIVCDTFLNTRDCEWLFFIDHDVILPGNCFTSINYYMDLPKKEQIPVLSGLYYAKGTPSPPLIFRGRGNSYMKGWKMGEKVWVDGIPMGCTLLHRSIIEASADKKYSESYSVPGVNHPIRRIFETPRKAWYDPESHRYQKEVGTEDIFWCDKILRENILAKAGWPRYARMKYPFLCDTSIFCKHIDLHTGKQYPEGVPQAICRA